jgi:peroxiredoxin
MTEDETKYQNESPVRYSDSLDLAGLLQAKKEIFLQNASDEKIALYQSSIDSLATSGILDAAVKEGMKVPNFTLVNAIGEQVELYELLDDGPVVLTWYRGGWCPYCNITLAALQQVLPDFKARNATLVAVSPEIPDSSLSDIDNKVAKEYGIAFEVQPEVMVAYNQSFSLSAYNGNESNELPLPATYVIDTDGTVKYSFLDTDYRKRAEPNDIVNVLEEMTLE